MKQHSANGSSANSSAGNVNNHRKRDGLRYNSNNNGSGGSSSSSSSNGRSSGGSQAGSMSFHEPGDVTRGFNDNLDYLLVNGIGSEVTVTVTSGVKYSGLLAAANLESTNGIDIVLRFPKIVESRFASNMDKLASNLQDTLLIAGEDVAEVELNSVDLTLDQQWSNLKKQESKEQRQKIGGDGVGFKTDVDISAASTAGAAKQRELQKWVPNEADERDQEFQTLEESSSSWDQFAVNEAKFGVKSTFDEHLYTTKVNKNDPKYQERLKEAERIAREIESQGTSGNIHIAEDRGIIVDDSGLDEEDKYSGVDRRGDELLAALKSKSKPSEGSKQTKYIPPTLRSQPHRVDPAIISSTTTTTAAAAAAAAAANTSTATKKPVVAAPVKTETKSSSSHSKKSHHPSKEEQIEELKKFSMKFKVPYDLPEDMKDILKSKNKVAASDAQSAMPKPGVNSKNTKRPSISSTSTNSKTEPKNTSKGSNQQISPSSGDSSTTSRRRTVSSFFGTKTAHTVSDKKPLFDKKFNIFLNAKEGYDQKIQAQKKEKSEMKSMEPFFFEKPYFTAPTWQSTVDRSYKSLFPDERTAIQEAQFKLQHRQMKSMNVAAMAAAANSHMGMAMGMYMPMQAQPMYYPYMPQMMAVMGRPEETGGSISPQAMASPQFHPMYMNAAPGGYGYPGAIPFQPVMGGNNNGTGNYRQSYHGYQSNNHNNSTSGHNAHYRNNQNPPK